MLPFTHFVPGEVAMTTKQQDAIALLKADHRKVEDLFEKFDKAKGPKKKALADEICMELSIHATIEEEISTRPARGRSKTIS